MLQYSKTGGRRDALATKTTTAATTSASGLNLPIDLIVDRISNLVVNRNDWNRLSLLNHEIHRKLCMLKQNAPWPTSAPSTPVVDYSDASVSGAIVLDVGRNIIPNELPYRGQPFEIRCMALSSSSKGNVDIESNDVIQEDWIACACNDGNIRLWNRQSGKRLILPANVRIDQISFLVDNSKARNKIQLISCGISPQILVYDIFQFQLGTGGGRGKNNTKNRSSPPRTGESSCRGRGTAAATSTTKAKLTSTTPVTKHHEFRLSNDFVGRVSRFAISPDGKLLITAAYHRPSRSNQIVIYENNNYDGGNDGGDRGTIRNSSRASADSDDSTQVSNHHDNRILCKFHHSGSPLLKVSPFDNGRYLASTKDDGETIIVWDLLHVIENKTSISSSSNSNAKSSNNNSSSSRDQQEELFSTPPHILLKGHKRRVWMITFSPNCQKSRDTIANGNRGVANGGGLLASVDSGDDVLLWDMVPLNDKDNGEIICCGRGRIPSSTSSAGSSSRSSVGAIAFGPNGKYLAVSHDDGTIEFWSTASMDRISTVPFPPTNPMKSLLSLITFLPPPFPDAANNEDEHDNRITIEDSITIPTIPTRRRGKQQRRRQRSSNSYFIDLAETNDGRTIMAADCETGYIYLQRMPYTVP